MLTITIRTYDASGKVTTFGQRSFTSLNPAALRWLDAIDFYEPPKGGRCEATIQRPNHPPLVITAQEQPS